MWVNKTMGLPSVVAMVCAVSTVGCAEVRYKAATPHDEVVDIQQEEIAGARSVGIRQTGQLVDIDVNQLCDVVEKKEIERSQVRESDENLWVEAFVMGMATAPLTTGGYLLYDSQFVYENDSQGPRYNSSGPDSAVAGGIISLVVGTAMMAGGLASAIRRGTPDVDESTVFERGDTIATRKTCQRTPGPVTVAGVLDNGTSVQLGATNNYGTLSVDLARFVAFNSYTSGNYPLSMQLQIGGELHGLIDLEPVLKQHLLKVDSAWLRAEPNRCANERTERACAAVRQFVAQFPQSQQAAEGNVLVASIGKEEPTAKTVTIAGPSCVDDCGQCGGDATCLETCGKDCQ